MNIVPATYEFRRTVHHVQAADPSRFASKYWQVEVSKYYVVVVQARIDAGETGSAGCEGESGGEFCPLLLLLLLPPVPLVSVDESSLQQPLRFLPCLSFSKSLFYLARFAVAASQQYVSLPASSPRRC